MLRVLTTDEQRKVNAKRRGEDRPSIFKASLDAEEQISEDFEAWLILLESGPRSALANWLRDLTLSSLGDDYIDLLDELIESNQTDIDGLKGNLDKDLDAFDDMWIQVQSSLSGFEDNAELGLVTTDVRVPIEDFKQQEDENTTLKATVNAVKDIFTASALPEGRRHEIQDLSTVILDYGR